MTHQPQSAELDLISYGSKLPATIIGLGSSVIEVFELPQHQVLDKSAKLRLGRVLRLLVDNGVLSPDDGTAVDKVVDLETYGQTKIGPEETSIMIEYGVDMFDLAAKFLHETGLYAFDDHQKDKAKKYREDIVDAINLFDAINKYYEQDHSIEQLADIVRILGGFKDAVNLSVSEIHNKLFEHDNSDDQGYY